jgi:rubrerythrin
MFTLEEIVRLAVQVEQNGEKVYREAQQAAVEPAIASLLGWLADDEARHAQWFEELETRIEHRTVDPEMEKMAEDILSDILGDQSFSLKEIELSQVKKTQDLLGVAIEFERDTVVFYQMLRSFVDDQETQGHLDAIIEEENRHIQALQEWARNPVGPFSSVPREI